MWIILLFISVITAATNDQGWGNRFRFNIGPLYVNIFLMALLIGFIFALLPPKPMEHTRQHRLFIPTIIWFAIGLVVGVLGTILNDSNLLLDKSIGGAVRDYMI